VVEKAAANGNSTATNISSKAPPTNITKCDVWDPKTARHYVTVDFSQPECKPGLMNQAYAIVSAALIAHRLGYVLVLPTLVQRETDEPGFNSSFSPVEFKKFYHVPFFKESLAKLNITVEEKLPCQPTKENVRVVSLDELKNRRLAVSDYVDKIGKLLKSTDFKQNPVPILQLDCPVNAVLPNKTEQRDMGLSVAMALHLESMLQQKCDNIWKYLDSRHPGWSAMHLRCEKDWWEAGTTWGADFTCEHEVQSLINVMRIHKVFEKRPKILYVAGGHSVFSPAHFKKAGLDGFEFFNKEVVLNITGGWSMADVTHFEVNGLIDFCVSRKANVFMGNGQSSFSAMIAATRLAEKQRRSYLTTDINLGKEALEKGHHPTTDTMQTSGYYATWLLPNDKHGVYGEN